MERTHFTQEQLANPVIDHVVHLTETLNRDRRPSGIDWRKIGDPGVRIPLRVSETLICAAHRTEQVRTAIRYSDDRSSEYVSGDREDLSSLIPGNVIDRIRSYVGLRGAIKVVVNAIDFVDNNPRFLNGDANSVMQELLKINKRLSGERKLELGHRHERYEAKTGAVAIIV